MSFNVINASAKITEQYRRYLKTIFDIAQPEYKQLFNEQLESADPFSKGPYLDVTDSFVRGQSVSQLVDNGVLSSEFKRLPDIYDKTLYLHQQKAIEKTLDGKKYRRFDGYRFRQNGMLSYSHNKPSYARKGNLWKN